MRILYLSCHSILEYDEVRLLHELGHEVFSPGAYVEPANPGDHTLRPSIEGLVYTEEVKEKWHALAALHPGKDSKDFLTKEFVDYFDTVIVMHIPRWITKNWESIKHKRVIWRTIGQSISGIEKQLQSYVRQGLQIVRYSPMERNIPGYIGEDALIRFYKDPEEYKDWTGTNKRIISFSQDMKTRDRACNFTFFEQTTRPFSRALFGPRSELAGDWGQGKVPFEQLQEELRTNRVYFYTGTHPASYTLNFIEAWMTGIPIVAIGSQHGNANYFPGHDLYEIPSLIQHGVNGFVSDNIAELRAGIKALLGDPYQAQRISDQGRTSAIKVFGKQAIKEQWKKFLDT